MKIKIITLLLTTIFIAGCSGKNIKEENAKLKADLDASQKREAALDIQVKEKEMQLKEQQKRYEAELAEFRGNFTQEENNGDLKIKRVKGGLSVSVTDKLFFASGKAVITPSGKNVLNKIARVVKQMPDKIIKIDGHTDNAPIKVGSNLYQIYPTNWELAASRAVNVVRYLTEKCGVDSTVISASSYSMFHPVESNDSKKGRALNRRIEIILIDKELNNSLKPQNP